MKGKELVSSRSSGGALIGDTATVINNSHNQVKFWFLRRGETGVPGENLSEQSKEPKNSHLTPDLRIEPGPHWWEASVLTTAPSLHSYERLTFAITSA